MKELFFFSETIGVLWGFIIGVSDQHWEIQPNLA